MKVISKKIRIKDIKPFDENPRKIDSFSYETLKKSLNDFPDFLNVRELVVDKDNNLLCGHQRYRILKEQKIKSITCKVVLDATEEEIKRIRIIDNIPAGKWDWTKLGDNFNLNKVKEWGLYEVQKILNQNQYDDEEEDSKEEEKIMVFSYITLYTGEDIIIKMDENEADDFNKLLKEYKKEKGNYDGFIKWLLEKRK